MKAKEYVAAVLAGLMLPGCYNVHSPVPAPTLDVSDGFESPTLSRIWDTSKFVAGDVVIQSQVVRAGQGAAKVTLHSGDHAEPGDAKSLPTERAELMEDRRLVTKEGDTAIYSFSMFIPQDFPIVPTRLVIAQWKQFCPRGKCEPDNPVVALRYQSGELVVSQQTGPTKVILYRTKDDVRNRWLDFRFQIHFSKTSDGMIKASLSGKEIVDYKGVTAYPEDEQSGYPDPSRFYFKFGLYRDQMAEPMSIFIDEYSKRVLTGGSH